MRDIKYITSSLLGSLVDLLEKELEDAGGKLLHVVEHLLDLAVRLLLVGVEDGGQVHLGIQGLDLLNRLIVVATVVLLKHTALGRSGAGEGLDDQPRALVVLDVSSDLADHLGGSVAVEVVVLDLEVLTHGAEDIASGIVELAVLNTRNNHTSSDGEIEGVEGSLVLDNGAISLDGESVKVDLTALGLRGQVHELAELRLASHLNEEVHELHVAGLASEVSLKDLVHAALEDKAIVDSDKVDLGAAVPAGEAATSDAAIHDVISDKEEALKELKAPAKGGGLNSLL